MSVYTTLFVTPRSAVQPTHTQLGRLVDELVSNNFVVPPWGVVEGTFNPEWPEYIGSYVRNHRNGHALPPDITVLAQGNEWTELPATIAQLPLGRRNLALWFADLNWSNPVIAQSSLSFAVSADPTTSSDTATLTAYRRVGNTAYRRVELTIFVLTEPHRLTGHDYETAEPQRRDWERHSQHYVTFEAKGLLQLQPSPLYAILYQHWCGNLDIYRDLS